MRSSRKDSLYTAGRDRDLLPPQPPECPQRERYPRPWRPYPSRPIQCLLLTPLTRRRLHISNRHPMLGFLTTPRGALFGKPSASCPRRSTCHHPVANASLTPPHPVLVRALLQTRSVPVPVPPIVQALALASLPGVLNRVGQALRGDLLGFGPGGRVAEHVDLLVGLVRVLGRLLADEHLHGAAQPAQTDLSRPPGPVSPALPTQRCTLSPGGTPRQNMVFPAGTSGPNAGPAAPTANGQLIVEGLRNPGNLGSLIPRAAAPTRAQAARRPER